MSMNLNASCGKEIIDLYQTPTYITDMCCMGNDGDIYWELKGASARRALYCYIEWVKGVHSGYDSKEEADWARKITNDHIFKIKSYINKKNLKVWKM